MGNERRAQVIQFLEAATNQRDEHLHGFIIHLISWDTYFASHSPLANANLWPSVAGEAERIWYPR